MNKNKNKKSIFTFDDFDKEENIDQDLSKNEKIDDECQFKLPHFEVSSFSHHSKVTDSENSSNKNQTEEHPRTNSENEQAKENTQTEIEDPKKLKKND